MSRPGVASPDPPSTSPPPPRSRGDGDGQSRGGGGSVGFTGTQLCYMRTGRAPAPATLRRAGPPLPADGTAPAPAPRWAAGSTGPPAGGWGAVAPSPPHGCGLRATGFGRPRGSLRGAGGCLCPGPVRRASGRAAPHPRHQSCAPAPPGRAAGTGSNGARDERKRRAPACPRVCPPVPGQPLGLPRPLGGQEGVRGSRWQLWVAEVLLLPALLPRSGPGGRAQVPGPRHRLRLQPCGDRRLRAGQMDGRMVGQAEDGPARSPLGDSPATFSSSESAKTSASSWSDMSVSSVRSSRSKCTSSEETLLRGSAGSRPRSGTRREAPGMGWGQRGGRPGAGIVLREVGGAGGG